MYLQEVRQVRGGQDGRWEGRKWGKPSLLDLFWNTRCRRTISDHAPGPAHGDERIVDKSCDAESMGLTSGAEILAPVSIVQVGQLPPDGFIGSRHHSKLLFSRYPQFSIIKSKNQ